MFVIFPCVIVACLFILVAGGVDSNNPFLVNNTSRLGNQTLQTPLPIHNPKFIKYDIVDVENGRMFGNENFIELKLITFSVIDIHHKIIDASIQCEHSLSNKLFVKSKNILSHDYFKHVKSNSNISNAWMFQLESNTTTNEGKTINDDYLLHRIKLLQYVDDHPFKLYKNKKRNIDDQKYYFWLVNVHVNTCFQLHIKTINEIDRKIYKHPVVNLKTIFINNHTNTVSSGNNLNNTTKGRRRRNILQVNKVNTSAEDRIYAEREDDSLQYGEDDDDDLSEISWLKRKKHAAMKGVSTFFELMGKDRHGHHSLLTQKAIDARNQRQLYLTMMEISDKTFEMSSNGIKTKEVYSMVIDKIMNRLPEIMVQVLISILRKPFIHFAGHFMELNAPGMIAPNSQDSPEVPVIANIPPVLVESGSTLNQKSKADHYHNHHMHQGGEQGGPVARVMPLLRQTVMHGMGHHVIPFLQDEIITRVINRFDVVQNSVLRNSVRWIAPTLTAAISSKSIGATLGKTHSQTLQKSNKKTAFLITKQLTLALAEAITLSMTHQPRSDYYCHYCQLEKIYCQYCSAARRKQTEYGYYANYFAGYFGHYYAQQYGGPIAEHFISIAKQVVSS
jgi:hypothetical protein